MQELLHPTTERVVEVEEVRSPHHLHHPGHGSGGAAEEVGEGGVGGEEEVGAGGEDGEELLEKEQKVLQEDGGGEEEGGGGGEEQLHQVVVDGEGPMCQVEEAGQGGFKYYWY